MQGILNEFVDTISFKTMSKWTLKEGEALLIEVQPICQTSSGTTVNAQLQELLAEFNGLFEEPVGLPPHRHHDHRIPLIPGAAPVNVRPYRYLYFQKTEIEKIVKEMLETGVIQCQPIFITRANSQEKGWLL